MGDAQYAYQDYSGLDWLCVISAFIVPVPAVVGAFRAWRARELGAGGRRPEPRVAALLASASGFLFGCTQRQMEAFLLNLCGGVMQFLAIVVFLLLNRENELFEALLICIVFAWLHYPMTMAIGISHIHLQMYKCLCTFASLLNAAAPLLTFHLLVDDPTAEHLPQWGLLVYYTVHSFLWVRRGWILNDYYMLAQNAVSALCSVERLVVLLCLTHHNRRMQVDDNGLREWLLAGLQPVP